MRVMQGITAAHMVTAHDVLMAHDYVAPYMRATRPSQQEHVPVLDFHADLVDVAHSGKLSLLKGRTDVLGRKLDATQVAHLKTLADVGMAQWQFSHPRGERLQARMVISAAWIDHILPFGTDFRNFLDNEKKSE